MFSLDVIKVTCIAHRMGTMHANKATQLTSDSTRCLNFPSYAMKQFYTHTSRNPAMMQVLPSCISYHTSLLSNAILEKMPQLSLNRRAMFYRDGKLLCIRTAVTVVNYSPKLLNTNVDAMAENFWQPLFSDEINEKRVQAV